MANKTVARVKYQQLKTTTSLPRNNAEAVGTNCALNTLHNLVMIRKNGVVQ